MRCTVHQPRVLEVEQRGRHRADNSFEVVVTQNAVLEVIHTKQCLELLSTMSCFGDDTKTLSQTRISVELQEFISMASAKQQGTTTKLTELATMKNDVFAEEATF